MAMCPPCIALAPHMLDVLIEPEKQEHGPYAYTDSMKRARSVPVVIALVVSSPFHGCFLH